MLHSRMIVSFHPAQLQSSNAANPPFTHLYAMMEEKAKSEKKTNVQ